VASGADALIVSNHGGRQLDGAESSIRALPAVVDAVGSQIEVHMDGGVRSGQDVLKARALGAKGVYIGRSFIYGLGAMGEAGVTKALEIIHKELDLSMALCGRTDINTIDKSILLPGTLPSLNRIGPPPRRRRRAVPAAQCPPAARGGRVFRKAYRAGRSTSSIFERDSKGITWIAVPSGRLPLRIMAVN
jgi:hypothetical protein